MKRFVISIIQFLLVLALIDVAFGWCCDYLQAHVRSGDARRVRYAITEGSADMLIMGSSRAHRHYNPAILADSLGLKVYNLGEDGSGVLLMYGYYRLIVERYVPKYILYELTPLFDVQVFDGDANNRRYLEELKPYYRHACLQEVFDDVAPGERYKLRSSLYRCCPSFVEQLRSCCTEGEEYGDGYEPLQGVMMDDVATSDTAASCMDPVKVKYLRRFIRDCQAYGTQLLFFVSPKYGAASSAACLPAMEVCREEGYEVLDYYCDSLFLAERAYFYDPFHLNGEGADAYTRRIIAAIKRSIQRPKNCRMCVSRASASARPRS